METRQHLLDSGMVEPGHHEDSELYQRVTSDDADLVMPPDDRARLDPDEAAVLANWIDSGLPWPDNISLAARVKRRPLSLREVGDIDPEIHPIDQILDRYFRDTETEPPKPLADRFFVRRASLDLTGLLPQVDELQSFERSDDPERYAQLVDNLLRRNRDYADHWMSFWNDLLRNDFAGTGYIDGGRKQITTWLHDALLDNKPYDRFVRELIDPGPESEGFIKGIKWRGEVNASQIQPLQFSQNVSQVFLGINMKCASCHDSFIDDWKLEDAYGLAAVISGKRLEIHRCDVPTGTFAESRFVFPELGQVDQSLNREQRLKQLAELLTTRENGRFARTIVNRIWHRMTGRGLVHPVDVMANPAWSEELLDYLASDLVQNNYDLKRTLTLIATSRIYRSQAVAYPDPGQAYVFRGVHVKRMTAEQFVDSVWTLTGSHPEKMAATLSSAGEGGTPVRASLVQSGPLMRSLGRPNREQVVTTRPAELSTLQALNLSNGEHLTNWLRKGAARRAQQVEKDSGGNARAALRQCIQEVYRKALSRPVTHAELSVLMNDPQANLQDDIQDVLWMVVMLPEFQFIN